MNRKIRVGIIGCGRAAEHIYFPLLSRNPDFVVTAAADPLKQRRKLASDYFTSCYTSADPDNTFLSLVDAAIITTPPGSHVKYAAELLNCSKHVLVEKPLSQDLRGIEDLKFIEKRSEAKLMMAFNHRYWKPLNILRDVLKAEQYPVISAAIKFSGNYELWDPVSFRSDPLNDLGPHVFDIIRFLFGEEIKSVSAVLREGVYNIKAVLANTQINTAISHSSQTEKIISIKTKSGEYFLTLGSLRISPAPGLTRNLLDINDRLRRKLLMQRSPIKETFRRQLKKFYSLCSTGVQADPGLQDGIAAIKAVNAACLSLEKNTEVYPDEIQ